METFWGGRVGITLATHRQDKGISIPILCESVEQELLKPCPWFQSFSLSRVRLLKWNRGQRVIPGQGLESEKATVCCPAVEKVPVCSPFQERFFRSGEKQKYTVWPLSNLLKHTAWPLVYPPKAVQWVSVCNLNLSLADCAARSFCVHRPDLQPHRSSFRKVSQLGTTSVDVWRAVHLHQVWAEIH